MELTQTEALRAYAKMMNTLDVSALEPLLADNFTYESQAVFTPLDSKQSFLDYIAPSSSQSKMPVPLYSQRWAWSPRIGGERQPCVLCSPKIAETTSLVSSLLALQAAS